MTDKVPTWGYSAEGARLFDLAPGEGLPPGWSDSPAKVESETAAPEPNSVSDKPNSATDADELGILKAKAAELGIVLRGRLSVERLKAAIAAVDGDAVE